MFHIIENNTSNVTIKVIGVGGGGSNALEHMIDQGIEGVEFIAVNTDAQALKASKALVTLQLGEKIVTNGLGAGADPLVGREAALESREDIKAALEGADMVFIASGMGGGTGTGAAPVIAEIANELGSLTVAVVTKPFLFEGSRRMQIAVEGVQALNQHVNALITIPNEKLITVFGKDQPMVEAFKEVDSLLLGAVQGIAEIITREGKINVDFADVKTVMFEGGVAMMGSGSASGENRAHDAAQAAISNPLLEDVDLRNAHGLLVNIMASDNLTMGEVNEIGLCMRELASSNAIIVPGAVIDKEMGDLLRVTLIATGLGVDNMTSSLLPDNISSVDEPVKIVPQSESNSVQSSEYDQYDTPAVRRRDDRSDTSYVAEVEKSDEGYDQYLDIPTFLRQQAD